MQAWLGLDVVFGHCSTRAADVFDSWWRLSRAKRERTVPQRSRRADPVGSKSEVSMASGVMHVESVQWRCRRDRALMC